ncbi:MAG: tetraacyldisaccharide 4'-kinase [Deltaproteobacteria bacterium]|nr:tetraacyldisaccharide 4'-kinase [Deltaproteobacteria bacterium]
MERWSYRKLGNFSRRLNRFFNELTEGNIKGFLLYLIFLPLYILSILYGIAVRFRFFLYRIRVFKTKRLNCKVISIGNITVGGSGKTPLTIYLAQRFIEKGKRPVILSRGYRGKIKDIGVVSDAKDVLLGPEDAGDEPYLMALKLRGVPVIVGRDRYKAGLYAIEKFNPDIIILDDGFQHIRLARDMDIALIDSRRGFGSGYLFPLGMLREPLNGLKRASLVMVKNGEEGAGCGKRVNLFPPSASCLLSPIFFSYKPQAMINLITGERFNVDLLKGKRIIALSGIADPCSFRDTLKRLEANVIKEIYYPDHHIYTLNDVEDIALQTSDIEMVIVTEKDAVKLRRTQIKHLPIYSIEIDVRLEDSDVFDEVVGLKNV